MAFSVPIHPISCRRPGVELGQPAAGLCGRPPKSQDRQSPQELKEGEEEGMVTGTQAHHL